MSSSWFGVIELLLVFGIVLGWAGREWWSYRQWKRRQPTDVTDSGQAEARAEPPSARPGDPPGDPR